MSDEAHNLRPTPASHLEERYRAVLRLLPAAYRDQWETDMVAAFLESKLAGEPATAGHDADASERGSEGPDGEDSDDWDGREFVSDFGRPSRGEIGSVAALAIRLRVTGAAGTARAHALNRAVRLAALMLTLFYAAGPIASLLVALWLASRHQLPYAALNSDGNLWRTARNLAGYAWLPAYVALALGYRRAAQAVASLAIAPFAVTVAVEEAIGRYPVRLSPWAMVLLEVLVVVAMAAIKEDQSGVRRRGWLIALPIGVLVVPLPTVVVLLSLTRSRLLELGPALDWPGLFCTLVTLTAVAYLAGCWFGRRAPALSWSAAIALLAGAAVVLRLVTLPDALTQLEHAWPVMLDLVEVTVTLAASAPLAVSAGRRLRELPALHTNPRGQAAD